MDSVGESRGDRFVRKVKKLFQTMDSSGDGTINKEDVHLAAFCPRGPSGTENTKGGRAT